MVKSESGFKKVTHKLSYVVGIAGINTKAWKNKLPANPCTDSGNIECAAYILKIQLVKNDGNYLRALRDYKGRSALGLRQARLVLANV